MNSLKAQLAEAVKLLDRMKIKYVVLGGVAVSIYGEPRFTADIDINILLDAGKVEPFIKEARRYGFRPVCRNIASFIKKTGVIPMRFSRHGMSGACDFIIAENALEMEALKRGRTRKIGSMNVRFVSPEDLFIHKITSERAKDIEDARGILLRQGSRLDFLYIRRWLKRLDKIDKGLKAASRLNRLTRRLKIKRG